MKAAPAATPELSVKPLRLSSRITGIVFWSAVLTGLIVVSVFIKQNEAAYEARQHYQVVLLLRGLENVLNNEKFDEGLASKKATLEKAIDGFKVDEKLVGAEIQIGIERVLLGEAPENAMVRTIESNHVVDSWGNSKMLLTAYFNADGNEHYNVRKNLIMFLGVVSFGFGLIINRVLKKMLTSPIDQMIATAAAYANGEQSVRFDESKDDEFGFMSRFINRALDSSELMHKQLASAAQEQRTAKEKAEAALSELKRAQDRLVQSEKLASLGQLTAGIAHEIKNPLNFVNNFSETSVELLDELNDSLSPLLSDAPDAKRKEITELSRDLASDLGTIAKHGKRADSIVKNMLLHSRSDSGDFVDTDLNSLVTEALNLAYHGERAADRNFQIEMKMDLDAYMKPVSIIPQDITRVLINLYANAFYATKKRLSQNAGTDYVPTVATSTICTENGVEIRVRDNGIGIPAKSFNDLFAPFFTTKPTGQGTGLGLSISHDIIVKQHGGSIDAKSEEGNFTEFVIKLPMNQSTTA